MNLEEVLFIGAPVPEDMNEYPFHNSAELLNQPQEFFDIPSAPTAPTEEE